MDSRCTAVKVLRSNMLRAEIADLAPSGAHQLRESIRGALEAITKARRAFIVLLVILTVSTLGVWVGVFR